MSGALPFCHNGWHSRGYLPHYDRPGLIQGITFRLADSVPVARIEAWKKEMKWMDGRSQPEGDEAFEEQRRELHRRIAHYEDSGEGECYLQQPEIARLMVEALSCFDGQRYELKAFCVMPNHVHTLILAFGEWTTGQVLQSWKTWTSREANRLLGRTGMAFWAQDYYDRFIRDEAHYLKAVSYLHQNPVKAGLVASAEAWPWSSACRSV
jgi:REP element-mobilizing transposase RayT